MAVTIYTQGEAIKMMLRGEKMLPLSQDTPESFTSFIYFSSNSFRIKFKDGTFSNPKDLVNLDFFEWIKFSDVKKVKPGETFTFNAKFYVIVKTAETTYRIVDMSKWESNPKINAFGLTIEDCLRSLNTI